MWVGTSDASSHTEQEESHAALQLQEITSVLMTQVSGECSTAQFRPLNCRAMQHVNAHLFKGRIVPRIKTRDCVRHKVVKDNYCISVCFSPRAAAYTHEHILDEKT